MAEEPKRGRGRPPTLPPGKRFALRCVVVDGEIEQVRTAADTLGLSQLEFTRKAVLELAKRTARKKKSATISL